MRDQQIIKPVEFAPCMVFAALPTTGTAAEISESGLAAKHSGSALLAAGTGGTGNKFGGNDLDVRATRPKRPPTKRPPQPRKK